MGASKNCYFILPFGKLRVNSAQDERGIVIIRSKTTLMVSLPESGDRTIIWIFRGPLLFSGLLRTFQIANPALLNRIRIERNRPAVTDCRSVNYPDNTFPFFLVGEN